MQRTTTTLIALAALGLPAVACAQAVDRIGDIDRDANNEAVFTAIVTNYGSPLPGTMTPETLYAAVTKGMTPLQLNQLGDPNHVLCIAQSPTTSGTETLTVREQDLNSRGITRTQFFQTIIQISPEARTPQLSGWAEDCTAAERDACFAGLPTTGRVFREVHQAALGVTQTASLDRCFTRDTQPNASGGPMEIACTAYGRNVPNPGPDLDKFNTEYSEVNPCGTINRTFPNVVEQTPFEDLPNAAQEEQLCRDWLAQEQANGNYPGGYYVNGWIFYNNPNCDPEDPGECLAAAVMCPLTTGPTCLPDPAPVTLANDACAVSCAFDDSGTNRATCTLHPIAWQWDLGGDDVAPQGGTCSLGKSPFDGPYCWLGTSCKNRGGFPYWFSAPGGWANFTDSAIENNARIALNPQLEALGPAGAALDLSGAGVACWVYEP